VHFSFFAAANAQLTAQVAKLEEELSTAAALKAAVGSKEGTKDAPSNKADEAQKATATKAKK